MIGDHDSPQLPMSWRELTHNNIIISPQWKKMASQNQKDNSSKCTSNLSDEVLWR